MAGGREGNTVRKTFVSTDRETNVPGPLSATGKDQDVPVMPLWQLRRIRFTQGAQPRLHSPCSSSTPQGSQKLAGGGAQRHGPFSVNNSLGE
jgi:hypothetical protein